MALDHMGLDSQLKFGTSRMGASLAESRGVDMSERAIKNDLLETKKTQRLGRRAYRAALRGQDSSAYLQGLKALETMKMVNGTTGAGIKMAGADQAGLEKHIGNTRSQIDGFNSKTLDNNGRLLPKPQSRILGNGSGATPQNAKASSNGGEWVNTAPQGASTPDTPQASSGPASQRPGLSLALGNLQAKWHNEARANDPARQQAAYEAANGTPAQQTVANTPPATTARVDGLVDKYASRFPGLEKLKGLTDADKADAVQQGKDALLPYDIASPGDFTPEDKRRLRRVVGLFGGSPQDEAQVRGEIAAGNLISRVSQGGPQGTAEAISGGVDAISSRLMGGFNSARNSLGRNIAVANTPQPPPQAPTTPAATLLAPPATTSPSAQPGGLSVRFGKTVNAGNFLSGSIPTFIPDSAPKPPGPHLRKKKVDQWKADSANGTNIPSWMRGTGAGRLLQVLQRPNL